MGPTTPVIGVGDGGIGLREELEKQFPTLQFIVDQPHVKAHLHDTADALGLSQQERAAWVEPRLDAICQGDVGTVTQELEEAYANAPHERVRRLIAYLNRFSDALDYQRFTEQGYPIGSGEVERAHKAIPQKRLKIPGACWHPESIHPMVALRIVRATHWWEDFWKERIEKKLST